MGLEDITTLSVKYVSSKFKLFLLIFNILFTPFTFLQYDVIIFLNYFQVIFYSFSIFMKLVLLLSSGNPPVKITISFS